MSQLIIVSAINLVVLSIGSYWAAQADAPRTILCLLIAMGLQIYALKNR